MIETAVRTKTTAIVLAGGASTRMGQDKALISLKEKPLLWHICTLASHCASQVYVITPWQGYQDILPDGVHLIREVWLPGQTKPHGPLIGFAQALNWVQTEWVLLLACDLPQLTASEVEKWSEDLLRASPEAIALLPRGLKGWEPLCGFYRQSCLGLLQEYIHQGGKSFQGWLAAYSVQELPVSDRQVLFNCNTPEEFGCYNTILS